MLKIRTTAFDQCSFKPPSKWMQTYAKRDFSVHMNSQFKVQRVFTSKYPRAHITKNNTPPAITLPSMDFMAPQINIRESGSKTHRASYQLCP